ncbi:MAG: hypothetical protein Q9163_001367 [Psora crenata]
MTAQSLDTFLLAFSDPVTTNLAPGRLRVNESLFFELHTDNVQTLSTNTANQGSDIEGLLYVPSLDPSDPCVNASSEYVPTNVTRLQDLPQIEYFNNVAFAPWFSAACTKSYLAAANVSTAFLFYVPSQNTTAKPPWPNDETWNLGDGGQWKSQNKYPVYAIPGPHGATIMQHLAISSSNLSQVKDSGLLLQEIDPTDYVRVFASFDVGDNSNLPTLWVFLLIVLAVVLLLVGATSFSMHYIQRRHRRDLQRRVENGEVDLETLGIKRQRLTQAQINTLPLIPYVPNEKKPSLPLAAESSPQNSAPVPPAVSPQDYSQPTCPICLDDYVPNETSVRSLPCHHIYHPACIDPFLLSSSSLCPVCKTKVNAPGLGLGTPVNASPLITNAMVRRERYARRLRESGEVTNANGDGLDHWPSLRRLFRPFVSHPRPSGSGLETRPTMHPPAASTAPNFLSMELGAWPYTTSPVGSNLGPSNTVNPPVSTAPVGSRSATDASQLPTEPTPRPQPPQDPERRREWARRRASALLGRGGGAGPGSGEVVDADEEEWTRRARMPKWRRAIGYVFPGFR